MLERFLCTLRKADFMPFSAKPSLLRCWKQGERVCGILKQDQNLTKPFCTSPFLRISCCCVPILSHLMLTSTSANIVPVIGYHGLLAHMQSCFKYTCIRLTVPPHHHHHTQTILTYTPRSERMKWQSGDGNSFLHIYSLSFAQLLINLFWILFCFPKKKKKKNLISKHPYPSIMAPGLDQGS